MRFLTRIKCLQVDNKANDLQKMCVSRVVGTVCVSPECIQQQQRLHQGNSRHGNLMSKSWWTWCRQCETSMVKGMYKFKHLYLNFRGKQALEGRNDRNELPSCDTVKYPVSGQ